jgi:hypothetical protein
LEYFRSKELASIAVERIFPESFGFVLADAEAMTTMIAT